MDRHSFVIDAGNHVLALHILLLGVSHANPVFETITGEARKSQKNYVAAPLMQCGLSRTGTSPARARPLRPVTYAMFAGEVITRRIADWIFDATNGTNPRHLSSRLRNRSE